MTAPLLDPSLNRPPPATLRHVHLMGICGTGMGSLAGMLQEQGVLVTGSDHQVYPPMSDFLAGLGIQVQEGYRPENLSPSPDLVVVGNVIRADNPEVARLAELAIPYLSFPQALGHFFLAGHRSLVVCGTHGKTTTSSLLAWLLHEAGMAPGFMIGGLVQGFGRNFQVGQGRYWVVEGDEYDTAFFDKGPKFLHYRPWIAVLTSIEFDHADIYADLEAVKAAFSRLVAILPADGALVACLDDPLVAEVAARAPCPVIGYGQGAAAAWQLVDLRVLPGRTEMTVRRSGSEYGRFTLPLPGRHNALNGLAVLAVLDQLGTSMAAARAGLASFQGVRRRQEVRGVVDGITVIDDFAHHPTSVRETLAALAQAYQGQRLVAVFEPRTNSSRRRVFQEAFAAAFGSAREVLVKEPEPLAGLAVDERFSARQLVADLQRRGQPARYFPHTEAILVYLGATARAGDVIAILSNGGFDEIHARLLASLASRH